jgi:hypothetical protein
MSGIVVGMAKRPRKVVPEVPRAVFDKFLRELEKDATLPDVVARLRPVLLESDSVTEAAIKSALLPDEQGDKSS